MLTRSLLYSAIRRPETWLLALAALAAWPLSHQLADLGLMTEVEDWGALAFEGSRLLALGSACVGLATLGRFQGLSMRVSPWRRLGYELGFLALLVLGLQLLAALGLLLEWPGGHAHDHGATEAQFGHPLRLSLALAMVDMHLVAMTLLLSRAPLAAELRAPALLLLAWGIPALLGSSAWGARLLTPLLAPGQTLAAPTAASETLLPWLATACVALAWLLLSLIPTLPRASRR